MRPGRDEGAGKENPVDEAATLLRGEAGTPWGAPSRFGNAGLLARRALLRVLRPYAVRQRQVDEALLEAIRSRRTADVFEPPSGIAFAEPLPENAIEIETDLGPLWFDRADNLITPLISEHHNWETDVVAFIRNRLAPGMVFLDVGAHAGYFSVLASSIVGDQGHVIAVEPHPRNLELLRANLWRHGCDNVTVLPVAANDRRGHVRLVAHPDGLAGASMALEAGETTVVPCGRLDDLVDHIRIDLIKIDIERGEHAAIRGAEGLIRTAPTLDIVAEFWTTTPHAGDRSPADVLGYYESLGLKFGLLQPDGTTALATVQQVLGFGAQAPILNIVLHKT
jgi:FkbM family methyltransferase